MVVDRFVVGVLEGTGTDVVTVVCSNRAQIGNGGSPFSQPYNLFIFQISTSLISDLCPIFPCVLNLGTSVGFPFMEKVVEL